MNRASNAETKSPSVIDSNSAHCDWSEPKLLRGAHESIMATTDSRHLNPTDLINGFHKFDGFRKHLSTGGGSNDTAWEDDEDGIDNFIPSAKFRGLTVPLKSTINNSSNMNQPTSDYDNHKENKRLYAQVLIYDPLESDTKHSLVPVRCSDVECTGGSVICNESDLPTICHNTTDKSQIFNVAEELKQNAIWPDYNNSSCEFIQSILNNANLEEYRLRTHEAPHSQSNITRTLYTYRQDISNLDLKPSKVWTTDNSSIAELRENGINQLNNYVPFPFTPIQNQASINAFYIMKYKGLEMADLLKSVSKA